METEKREKHSDITSFLIRSNNHFTKKTDRLVAHSSLVRNPTVSFQDTEIPDQVGLIFFYGLVECKFPNTEGFVCLYQNDFGEYKVNIMKELNPSEGGRKFYQIIRIEDEDF